ncbi:ribonuclease P protein component [Skermania piniformis]|uniref:Ribonuclease P protein component n=1 Tax=Skermania pinensis TaxID=39122 RepID=A0ABX8SBF5_9ACTN|nr:ribonuclease P protein component [Skermania piniformis]QXQ13910.1 ribonuclease P protein component [Skermania piniformis]
MLADPNRIRRGRDFTRAVRQGRRTGRQHFVLYGYERVAEPADSAAPRFGLIVGKAVGTAVVRHRVARRLRHVSAQLVPEIEAPTDVVIRVLPTAATASSAELDKQLRSGLRKLGVIGARR